MERLVRKSQTVEIFLNQNNFHWEETFWWLLAKNFGIKVNADAFEAIARSISINILAKHKTQIHQLEALLLGQAGLLDEKFTDDYPLMLQKEYKFYKNKYSIKPINLPIFFLRMRPGNFHEVAWFEFMKLAGGATAQDEYKCALSRRHTRWRDATLGYAEGLAPGCQCHGVLLTAAS